MNVKQLTPIIISLYNADITGMFWGQPGIGKSTSFRAAAEALRTQIGLTGPVLERHEVKEFIEQGGDIKTAFGMFDVRLGQSDPVDIGGLPREDKANGTMERLPPSWFPHTLREDVPNFGILLLDEFPSAPLSVQTAAYQITLDGVIDRYQMKDGWCCFAAGNRVSDGGQYFKMPYAQANRMCHIEVESDLDSWVDWGISKNIDYSLLAFVRFKPDLLNTYEKHTKEKGKGFAFATERMWEKVNDFLTNNQGVDDTTMLAILGGLVGAGTAAEYIAFRKVWQNMVTVDQVVMNPDVAHLPEDAATQYAVCTALAAGTTTGNLPQMLQYIERFVAKGRAELSILYIKDMQRRSAANAEKAKAAGDTTYVRPEASATYAQWAVRNKDLFG